MYECCVEEKKLIGRINKIKGQADSVKRLLEAGSATNDRDRDPYEVVRRLVTIKGSVNSMIHAYVDHFAKNHLINDIKASKSDKEAQELIEELTNILKTYAK